MHTHFVSHHIGLEIPCCEWHGQALHDLRHGTSDMGLPSLVELGTSRFRSQRHSDLIREEHKGTTYIIRGMKIDGLMRLSRIFAKASKKL